MPRAPRNTAWLSQQRTVPAKYEPYAADYYPPLRPCQVTDLTVSDDYMRSWHIVDVPDDVTGAIAFTTVLGLQSDRLGQITFDLPTVCKIDEDDTPSFPDKLYVKKVTDPADAVLTTESGDGISGGPTYIASDWFNQSKYLVMVDAVEGGGGGGLYYVQIDGLLDADNCSCLVASATVERIPCSGASASVGDTITIYDDLRCDLNTAPAEEWVGVRAIVVESKSDGTVASPLGEYCDPDDDGYYDDNPWEDCHFSIVRVCCP